VIVVALFILSLAVSAVVLYYFSPARTTSSIMPATEVPHYGYTMG